MVLEVRIVAILGGFWVMSLDLGSGYINVFSL